MPYSLKLVPSNNSDLKVFGRECSGEWNTSFPGCEVTHLSFVDHFNHHPPQTHIQSSTGLAGTSLVDSDLDFPPDLHAFLKKSTSQQGQLTLTHCTPQLMLAHCIPQSGLAANVTPMHRTAGPASQH